MDEFEQFFKENRIRLDTENLESSHSERIVHSFRRHHRKRVVKQIFAAASVSAIIILSIVLYHVQTKQPTGLFSEIATDLIKEETLYIQSINNSVNAIEKQKIPAEYEPMFEEFTQQLQIIDKQYAIYKTQIEQHGYNEGIIQQIIYNYQLKLSVLQMLQSEINKINNLSKQEHHEYKKIRLDI